MSRELLELAFRSTLQSGGLQNYRYHIFRNIVRCLVISLAFHVQVYDIRLGKENATLCRQWQDILIMAGSLHIFVFKTTGSIILSYQRITE